VTKETYQKTDWSYEYTSSKKLGCFLKKSLFTDVKTTPSLCWNSAKIWKRSMIRKDANYIMAILDQRKKFVAHERFQYVLLKKFGESDTGVSSWQQTFSKIVPSLKRNCRVFHGFWQTKFAYDGSILGSSQFTLLPQLPLKTMLSLKVVKIDCKISNLIH